MEDTLKLALESLIFSPLAFLVALLGVFLARFFRKRTSSSFILNGSLLLWALLFLFSSHFFFQLFSYPLKQITPKSETQKVDAIVVASAGVDDSGAPTESSAVRAYMAGRLYLAGGSKLVVVTGGVTTPYRPPVDTKGMHIILKGMGVPDEDILIETQSANTYGNGVESGRILKKRGIKRILLVSHDYHLYRLMGVFKKQGFEAYPYAANLPSSKKKLAWWKFFDWNNLRHIRTIAHEYIGLLTYKLSNRI